MNRILLWFFTALLFAAAPLLGQSSRYGTVSGRVIDAGTGKPLAGANIILESTVLGAAAGRDGTFTISRVKPGTYTVTAMMIGYKKQSRTNVSVSAGRTVEVRFGLNSAALEMPTMVVTASKRRQSIAETPVSVDVVSREMIQSRSVTTLDEVLVNTAGVGVIGGQLDIRGSTGFNWSAGSRVLLMVDGHPLINGDTGGISWDAIPVEQVESVEVVKGAGSALYGSNAMAGMVNIITRDPSLEPETNFRLSTGFYDEPAYSQWRWTDRFLSTQIAQGELNLRTALSAKSVDISHSRRAGPVGLLLTLGRKVSDGYQQNGDYSRWSTMFKAKMNPVPNQTFSLTGTWAVNDHADFLQWKSQERALEVPEAELGNRVTNKKTTVHASFKHGVNSRFAYTLKANFFRTDWQNYYNDNSDYAVTDRLGFEVQTDYIRGRHSLTAGSEVVLHRAESLIYGDQQTADAAVYLEDVFKLRPGVNLTIGGRFDYHKVQNIGTDRQISPRIGLTAQPWQGGSLRCSAGYGFRAPSIAEVFANLTVSGFRVVPNLELKEAERAWNFEAGLHQGFRFDGAAGSSGPLSGLMRKLSPAGMADLAFFYSRYTNMIDVHLNSDLMAFQFINLNKARNLGMELRVSAVFCEGLFSLNSGVTVIDPLNLETGRALNYRSRYRFTGGGALVLGRFTLALDYRYSSRAEEVVDIFSNDQRVPMHVADARILYSFADYQIGFETKNIRNYHYSLRQRSVEPVRQFVLSLRGKI